MILLRTLGSCDLVAPDRPGATAVLAQPKRFALLTYLALARPREFIRRDSLLALFWPETDQARGRRVLRQTVYLLRQSLGPEAIRSRGDEELDVDPAIVRCDVTAFEEAFEAGRAAEALELYRGDFLAGFHVPDASPDLDEWIGSERRRLRSLATGGAWRLAITEERAGNLAGVAYWARRTAELDPLDENRIIEVMQMLARVGDRAGALRAYAEHARRAEEDLGMQPGPELRRLADSLRLLPEPRSEPKRAQDADDAENRKQTYLALSNRAPEITSSHHEQLPRRRVGSRLRHVLLWAAPALAAVALGWVLLHDSRESATVPVIAVGPIIDPSADRAGRASNVPGDLLSTSLTRLTGVQVIPVERLQDLQSQMRAAGRPVTSVMAAAKLAGARELIQGTLLPLNSGGLQLDLQVIDLESGAVVRGYRVQGVDLFGAVDQATNAIAVAYSAPAPRERIAEVTTHSLLAYGFYDQGLQAYRRGDWNGAYRLFIAALGQDTSFAMAAYYAGVTAATADRSASVPLMVRAARLANRVPDRERLLILVGVTETGMSSAANALADTFALRYPLDPAAQYAAGRVAVWRGDFLAAARQYRRVITMDSLSLTRAVRCLACDAYERLIWAFLLADSAAAAERAAREYNAVQRGSPALGMLAMVFARQEKANDAWASWQAMDSLGADVNLDLGAAGIDIRKGDFRDADERLRRLMRESNSALSEEAGWLLSISLRNQGRHQEALRVADRLPATLAAPVVLFETGHPREAAASFERRTAQPSEYPFPGHLARHNAWMLTHVATSLAAAGDTARLAVLADSVQKLGLLSAFGRDHSLHHYIRALLWNARGQPTRAVEAFHASIWSWSDGYTRANYELARTLLRLNRAKEAVYPLQAALRGDLESSNSYVTRTELHELLARVFDTIGRADSAAVHYRHVVNAWQSADSQFTQRRLFAQRRLAALHSPDTPRSPRR